VNHRPSAIAVALLATLLLLGSSLHAGEAPRGLKVSDNHRFLVHADGSPFFYLGDTAWELFHRLTREESDQYLKNRADKGFTVIQAVALAELDGTGTPSADGHLPLIDRDPTRPNEDYFQHVDWVVKRANELGLVIGMLPTWGSNWHDKDAIFTPENASVYGEWLGRRYKDAAIIWILGGDRNVDNDHQRAILNALAAGLKKGDAGAHLMTFHPRGGATSAEYFHEAPWLDFNMNQNGHAANSERYEATRAVYDRTPIKPVLDGEPLYEDHPIDFSADKNGHSIAADVRRPLYWDLFQGAFGHTYGHHSVWQMAAPSRPPINNPLLPWNQAIDQPGAGQMQHARHLLESRPFLTRIPADDVIVPARPDTAVPGRGLKRYAATRDAEGSYALVYAPIGRPFTVRLSTIKGPKVNAWWFNPRTGEATAIPGDFTNEGEHTFTPPTPGEDLDWILVLDDASRHFPPPGSPTR
jgi:hypothetical protein